MRRCKVRIIYKSGAQIDIECDSFKVTRTPLNGGITLTWANANPRPLLIGTDDVAAVWELNPR